MMLSIAEVLYEDQKREQSKGERYALSRTEITRILNTHSKAIQRIA